MLINNCNKTNVLPLLESCIPLHEDDYSDAEEELEDES